MTGDRRLRVLFLPLWYPDTGPQSQVNGVFVREHARAAARFDDVAVLYRRTDVEGDLITTEPDDHGVSAFTYRYDDLRIPGVSWLKGLPAVMAGFRRVADEWGMPDLVHAQEPTAAFWARRIQRRYGTPYVVSQHWSGFFRQTASPVQKYLARYAFPHAKVILGANAATETMLAANGIRAEVRWLPNAFDPEVFGPGEARREDRRVLHVSGFTAEKRVLDVVDGFAEARRQLPDATLVMVGDGRFRRDAEQRAQQVLPPGSFEFLGFMQKQSVAEQMRRSSVLVLPSEFENQPCVLIEAMACGLPVVTTRVGSIPQIVTEHDGVFVDVGAVEAIGSAIVDVLQHGARFDPEAISRGAGARFSAEVVGALLHQEHLAACGPAS